MNAIYGRDFAAVYNEKWASWGKRMWPFLCNVAKKQYPNATTWLDLCCGTGALLKVVCEQGYSAVGVDFSRYQLHYAKQNAPTADLQLQDIRDLSLLQTFDVITCMQDSLNYLTSKQDWLRVLRRVRSHLNTDGLFAFDVNTFQGFQAAHGRATVMHDAKSTIIVEISFDEKRASGCFLITGFLKRGKLYKRFQEKHIERACKPSEVEDLLNTAGFSFKKYDENLLSRPRKRSGRLLYLCHKKKAPTTGCT